MRGIVLGARRGRFLPGDDGLTLRSGPFPPDLRPRRAGTEVAP